MSQQPYFVPKSVAGERVRHGGTNRASRTGMLYRNGPRSDTLRGRRWKGPVAEILCYRPRSPFPRWKRIHAWDVYKLLMGEARIRRGRRQAR